MAKLVPQEHPALRTTAEEVPLEEISSPKIQKVLKDMRAVLLDCPQGVAIAAPQIGVPLRIFLVHDSAADTQDSEEPRTDDMIAINPKIVKASRKKINMEEGCLSVPNRYGTVTRAAQVMLRAYDENGQQYERGASGLLAQIFQHETDHLDGILYIDHAHDVWETDDNYQATS